MGVPQHLITLTCNLHSRQEATVRIECGYSLWLTPYTENWIRFRWRMSETGGGNISDLRYADDTLWLAESSNLE